MYHHFVVAGFQWQ